MNMLTRMVEKWLNRPTDESQWTPQEKALWADLTAEPARWRLCPGADGGWCARRIEGDIRLYTRNGLLQSGTIDLAASAGFVQCVGAWIEVQAHERAQTERRERAAKEWDRILEAL